jgi:hypothetical protein
LHFEDFADPYYLERIFSYRKLVLKMIETIRQRTKIRKEFSWVVDQFVHNDYALSILFQNAAREVENRWFDDLSQESQAALVYFGREGFTEPDIARSISTYKALYDDSIKKEFCPFRLSSNKLASNAVEQITLAALYYANKGLNDIPYWLFSNLLANGFPTNARNKAMIQHNLGLFEMLNHKYTVAVSHFESASKFWFSERTPLLEKVDSWNLTLARERAGEGGSPERQIRTLLANLEEGQVPIELRLFLILQFAEIADLLFDKLISKMWLEKGVECSSQFDDFSEIALYFEARLGSFGILGCTEDERRSTLGKLQAMIEKYSTTFGDTENFIVVAGKKFYLLRTIY